MPPPFTEEAARAAISQSVCWSDALRKLGYTSRGANYQTLQWWTKRWGIATDHFDPNIGRFRAGRARRLPLKEVLVQGSAYPRGHLKRRLFAAGLKQAICEMCGQGESWNGRPMSLVLDHINGISNDHRLENLRIVCPNCAATLDTHCGRNLPRERSCAGCGQGFAPKTIQHRYCSETCWGLVAAERYRGIPHPETRKVERPSYEQLQVDVAAMSMLAVGRKYGVSGNAVRNWLRWYERQAASDAESQDVRGGGHDGPSDAQAA
jgi:hypothetical protein